jgi:Rrf2 family protein
VIVPARLDYALLALLSLARAPAERTKVDVIATEHALSRKFLAHTLTTLRDAGMVVTRRGASGGYRLARPASEISVVDVFDALSVSRSPTARPNGHSSTAGSATAWRRIEDVVRTGLGALSIADLATPATPARAPRRSRSS